jgi:hypothetical protein
VAEVFLGVAAGGDHPVHQVALGEDPLQRTLGGHQDRTDLAFAHAALGVASGRRCRHVQQLLALADEVGNAPALHVPFPPVLRGRELAAGDYGGRKKSAGRNLRKNVSRETSAEGIGAAEMQILQNNPMHQKIGYISQRLDVCRILHFPVAGRTDSSLPGPGTRRNGAVGRDI